VVIGSHVSDVYKDLMANSGIGNDSDNREFRTPAPAIAPKNGVKIEEIISIKRLKITMGWLADTSGVYLVLFSIADGLFTFLPIMLSPKQPLKRD
jgi:PTS system beta-glucosides-specific IIC component